jgi:hypothetical protein
MLEECGLRGRRGDHLVTFHGDNRTKIERRDDDGIQVEILPQP